MAYGLFATHRGGWTVFEEINAWVVSCDVDAREGRGSVELSKDPARALRFATAAEALQYWQRQSSVQPLRDDGKPNRPLTAYTCRVAPLT